MISEDDTHVKRIVFSPKILAKAVFADPELTLDLPPGVTAATGMDALTHNVESYLSPAYHPLCDGIALEGVRIAARALPIAVRDGRNLAARSDMMMASMMGAIAFQKDLGAVHSCAHALSTVADLHHGLANGIMIDHVMRFNRDAATQKMAEIARVAGVPGGDTGSQDARADAFIDWLTALKAQLGIPATLSGYRGDAQRHARRHSGAGEHRREGPLPPDQSAPVHAPRTSSDCSRPRCEWRRSAIGISASFFHADPTRPIFKGMTLQYIEQNIAHWLMQRDVLAFMVPSPDGSTRRATSKVTLDAYADALDALVLMGGSDVAPETYGEAADQARVERRPRPRPVRDRPAARRSWRAASRCWACAAARSSSTSRWAARSGRTSRRRFRTGSTTATGRSTRRTRTRRRSCPEAGWRVSTRA